MQLEIPSLQAHPVGASNFPADQLTSAWPVDTLGGRYYAEFDNSATELFALTGPPHPPLVVPVQRAVRRR